MNKTELNGIKIIFGEISEAEKCMKESLEELLNKCMKKAWIYGIISEKKIEFLKETQWWISEKKSPTLCKAKSLGIAYFEAILGGSPWERIKKILKQLLEKFLEKILEKS